MTSRHKRVVHAPRNTHALRGEDSVDPTGLLRFLACYEAHAKATQRALRETEKEQEKS